MESTVEDGPRLKHFRSALQKMLLASMKQCTSTDKVDQTFRFNLAPIQLSQLEEALTEEFSMTSDLIKSGFEKTLELHELPPKLNQIDAALRALPPNHQPVPRTEPHPDALVSASLVPSKQAMLDKLKLSVAQLKMANAEMEADVTRRQAVVENRIASLKMVRAQYVEAFSHCSELNVTDMETMIDRMAHQQTVPFHTAM